MTVNCILIFGIYKVFQCGNEASTVAVCRKSVSAEAAAGKPENCEKLYKSRNQH